MTYDGVTWLTLKIFGWQQRKNEKDDWKGCPDCIITLIPFSFLRTLGKRIKRVTAANVRSILMYSFRLVSPSLPLLVLTRSVPRQSVYSIRLSSPDAS